MPIHDVGYRPWSQAPTRTASRWYVLAETGVRLAWKSQWLRRMLFVAWLPSLYLGTALFAYEQFTKDRGTQAAALWLLHRLPESDYLLDPAVQSGDIPRRAVWALLLLTLFRYPQGVLMVMLVGFIAPPLISQDLRSRAYLLYFSRPLGAAEYVLGKSLVVWFYLFMITAVPALGLYVLGVSLAPDLSVVRDTWDLPLRILAASIWLIVPTTAMALCFSALTVESRYASAAWFAVWTMGWLAYTCLVLLNQELQRDAGLPMPETRPVHTAWSLVSLYHCLGRIQVWVFGLEADITTVASAIALVTMLTLTCLVVLLRRVTTPLRS